MYKIVGVADLEGNFKEEQLNQIKSKHSLYGDFWFEPIINMSFFFNYENEKDVSLRSSTVQNVEWVEEEKLYIITTRNSVYYIHKED